MNEVFVDSYISPIMTSNFEDEPKNFHAGGVTEESVKAELAERGVICIPSRKSLMYTPELHAKRVILKKMVYRGEISIDFSVATPGVETSETCLVFYNTKPDLS